MSDKRTVTTDALETLGTIIGENEKRDAIHLAVEPIIAGHDLRPGEHVGIFDKKAYTKEYARQMGIPMPCLLGIVDPFLELQYSNQLLRNIVEKYRIEGTKILANSLPAKNYFFAARVGASRFS